MSYELPTEAHLALLESATVELAVDMAWVDPATGEARVRGLIEGGVRSAFNGVRGRLGLAISISPEPAIAGSSAPPVDAVVA